MLSGFRHGVVYAAKQLNGKINRGVSGATGARRPA
jgi:hypothetical protein